MQYAVHSVIVEYCDVQHVLYKVSFAMILTSVELCVLPSDYLLGIQSLECLQLIRSLTQVVLEQYNPQWHIVASFSDSVEFY